MAYLTVNLYHGLPGEYRNRGPKIFLYDEKLFKSSLDVKLAEVACFRVWLACTHLPTAALVSAAVDFNLLSDSYIVPLILNTPIL